MTDKEQISKYRKRLSELRDRGLVRSGPMKLTLRLSSDGPAELNVNEDLLRSLLLDIRQFQLQNEAIRFDLICDLVEQCCSRKDAVPWIKYCRKTWDSTWNSLPDGIAIKECPTLEDASKLVFYGSGMFHTNERNQKLSDKWDGMSQGLQTTVKYALVASLGKLISLLALLDQIIASLDDPNSEVPRFPGTS